MSLTGQKPQNVIIVCNKSQGEYIKSFPLHKSQQLIEETKQKMKFWFFLYPTYDFIQEILSFGKEVVVTEPKEFVEEIKLNLLSTLENYNN